MTPTLNDTRKRLGRDTIKTLATRRGPCLTFLIPNYHPGAPEGSRRAVVRGLVKTATEQLTGGKLAPAAGALLASLDDLAGDAVLESGGPGLAIFRAPGFADEFEVQNQAERLVVGSHFYLIPLLAGACAPREMLILGLSTKRLRFFEYTDGECRELDLPAGVPDNLAAAGQFNRSDPQLSNRKAAGPAAVHFGTTTDREAAGAYLGDFFEQVDRGLKPVIAGRPLLLLGVKEEITAYRRAAANGHGLLTGHPGNVDSLSLTDVAARAREAASAEYLRGGEAALAEYREMNDRRRTSGDVRAVLHAAARGQVHRLCVREETPVYGEMPPELDRARLPAEDLINAAVVETVRTGGEVFVLPRDSMPATEPVAAILRY